MKHWNNVFLEILFLYYAIINVLNIHENLIQFFMPPRHPMERVGNADFNLISKLISHPKKPPELGPTNANLKNLKADS